MQTLKRTKQLVGIGHIKTGAVITYKIYSFVLYRFTAEGDVGTRRSRAKLPGITEQIIQYLPQQLRIAAHSQAGFNGDQYGPVRLLPLVAVQQGSSQGAQVNRLPTQSLSRHLSQRQHDVNELTHLHHPGAYARQVVLVAPFK